MSLNESDPLSAETVAGQAEAESPHGQARRDAHRAALDAQDKGDLDAMFAAYRGAVEDRAVAEEMWCQAARNLVEKPSSGTAGAEAIRAIRDVALAAIALAEKVAVPS